MHDKYNDEYNDEYLTDRLNEMERYFYKKEEDMLEHIRHLERRVDYHESLFNDPETLLSNINIVDIEKFLRKAKLQNISKNQK